MNRRSFLVRLGQAAAAAAALTVVPDRVVDALEDPERALWTPGAKTIIDFGATKNVVPATDAELLVVSGPKVHSFIVPADEFNKFVERAQNDLDASRGHRDIKLELVGADGSLVKFQYKGERLVSTHSAEELRLLDMPFDPRIARAPRIAAANRQGRDW